jgi:membrane protease subunit (stomatin/prohibitin family)
MGIINFIKGGVQEMMLQRPDDKKDLIVFKHPDQTVPMFSQLTVDADEAAVFFRDGAVVGTLRTAGVGQRHTLSTQNIPFLGGIVDRFTGGNIFTTDLFFVTMRPIFDIPFGGELGMIEDPMLGEMVTPRIFGKFAFQVVNPEAFIVRYTGIRQMGGNEEALKWVKGLFIDGVKAVIGEVCVTQQKSLLELMPLQQQLSQMFLARCPDLNNIGCAVVQMGQFNINLSDEDRGRLQEAQAEIGKAKRAAKIAKIGISEAEARAAQKQFELDQQFGQDSRYVQQLAGGSLATHAAAQAMMGAGKGMAAGGGGGDGGGGAMLGGAGLGVGMGIGQAMMQQQTLAAQQQAAAQQAAAPMAAPSTGPVKCGACNATVPAGKFCQECGGTLTPKPRFCPACGTPGVGTAKFCANCGTGYPQ